MSSLSTPFEAQRNTLLASLPIRTLYWSVRRELWENRSLYVAPAAAAMLFLLGFLISITRLPAQIRGLSALAPLQQHQAIATPYDMAAALLMLITMVVGAFYCVEAFQGERRDRSILFWKSLPVSDRTTVLAKAIIPLLFLPLLTFAITFALQSIMLLASTAILWARGLDANVIWSQLSFPRMTLLLFYHLVTVHALWHAPLYAWLLLVSAWAPRAGFLWAVLPPVAISTVERGLFGTSYFTGMLEYRLSGGGTEASTAPGTMPMDAMTHPTFGQFLLSPGLWIGLLLTAIFLAAAVRLRHYRGPAL